MRKKQELNEQFFKNSDQAGVIVRDFLVVGGLVVTAEGVDEYVVRSFTWCGPPGPQRRAQRGV